MDISEILTAYKNRDLDPDKPVKVYRNLTIKDRKVYSVMQDGLVVAHATSLMLYDVEFKVSAPSRLRVLREKLRNVHAFAIGRINLQESLKAGEFEGRDGGLTWEVTYNPYTHERFVATNRRLKSDVTFIERARAVMFNQSGVSAMFLN
jgi:hypothetical protein